MTRARFVEWRALGRASSVLAYAAIAASAPACSEPATPAGDPAASAAPAAAGDPDVPAFQPAVLQPAACTTVVPNGPFSNAAFTAQHGRFHVEYDATPTTNSLDGTVGLSAGAATGFPQLAIAVRFNTLGTIDVRDGDNYRADIAEPYAANTSYHIRIDVNLRGHSYSAWLRNAFGGYDELAAGYGFRTEQLGVTSLDTVDTKIDSQNGNLTTCGFVMVADATTADGCVVASAGDGFETVALTDTSVLDTLGFTATVDTIGLDAVVALSAGVPANFNGLATAVRFNVDGNVDARNAAAYQADIALPYDTDPLQFRVIADVTSKTYSVFEGSTFDASELARQYAFRTGAPATHLDHLAIEVDGPSGTLTVCFPYATPSVGAAYSREGTYAVVPL
ncbi:MAG TPA: hypothetical protein VH165_30390, partial [Kofleriaceae bacterium]|nr:hypothetical protein [Kofleriaceae bacterium]